MTIKASVKMNLNFPLFNTQEQLEQIAKKIIVPDIQGHMTAGVGIDESAHKPNLSETIRAKSRKGLRTSPPLIASGQLFRSFKVSLFGKTAVSIMPIGVRSPYSGDKSSVLDNNTLADILQNKGVGTFKHKYNFFGISLRAEGDAIKFMVEYIKKEIENGRQRFVR